MTRKDGLTPPRTDLPTVGMVIVEFEPQGKPRYVGPMTVAAVDVERPRITLRCSDITDDGCWFEWDNVVDCGIPSSGGPPYNVFQWNLVTDLNESDRARIDQHVAELRKKEPEARMRADEVRAAAAAYRAERQLATQPGESL